MTPHSPEKPEGASKDRMAEPTNEQKRDEGAGSERAERKKDAPRKGAERNLEEIRKEILRKSDDATEAANDPNMAHSLRLDRRLPTEAVKVEETLKHRVLRTSGLQNFDPPYSPADIAPGHRAWSKIAMVVEKVSGMKKSGMDEYHNRFVWPWVTCQNIQVKIKIATQHPDKAVRGRYKQEALDDLVHISEIFKKAGGAYEILDPDEYKRGEIVSYTSPPNFVGSMAAHQGAYRQIKRLGWIDNIKY